MSSTLSEAKRESAPLVSVIVRSVGRSELADALASIAEQTYSTLEVVVVDATGGSHPPLADHCGPYPLRFVPGTSRRIRPVAANAGLDAAQGDYVGFLDDDDSLLPEHVEVLVATLEQSRAHVLAYSIARQVERDGTVRPVGNANLTRLVLCDQCHFPPCAALFRRSVISQCRFDESLEAAEDWDFWLQVARVGEFQFVPRETAIYRADLGRSAMSTNGFHDEAARWRAVVRSKWAGERRELWLAVDTLYVRALERSQRGDTAQARSLVDQALRAYPHHVPALNLSGALYAHGGDLAAATRDFELAVDISRHDTASLYNLAQAFEASGRRVEAAALYRRVLALEPAHGSAGTRLAALGALPDSTR
jgi:hypothetical protein